MKAANYEETLLKVDHAHYFKRMKNRRTITTLLLLAIICLPYALQGQVAINLTDSTPSSFIGKSLYYFIDSTERLTHHDVLQPSIDRRFVKGEKEVPNFGNVELVVWNKFTVVNHSSTHWILSNMNDNDLLRFYYKDTLGNYQEIVSGTSMPVNSRKYKTSLFAFDLPVKYGDTATFYLQVATRNCEYTLLVSSFDDFVYDEFKRIIFSGFYYGLVFVIIIYNLAWFIAVKDRTYVYYMLYVLFTALLISVITGIYPFLITDQLHFLWNRGPVVTALGGIFLCVFGKRFLQLKQSAPAFHFIITYLLIPMLCFDILLSLVGNNFLASVLNQLIGVVGLIILSIAAIIVYRRGFKAARFYILACSFYFIGVFAYVLKAFAILPYHFLTRHAMEIGSAIEMMMFSVSMTDRINIFRTEHLNSQQALINSLQEKASMQYHMLELEAKALRSQMNPHFIFNCMNSIKSLIQQQQDEKAVNYLTTFSKLLRTILQNADKREITLHDEIETCRLYTQLESLRFGNKFHHAFKIDDDIDLKSIEVPALIIQPFIENAIWHGLMPKEGAGYVHVSVKKTDEEITCIIDDDGIGRGRSPKNSFHPHDASHQSKGVKLTQSRLDLDNALNHRQATVETIDKKDKDNEPAGTTIILTFKEY
jgi:hypothetical protein